MINLLPKEKQSGLAGTHRHFHLNQVIIVVVVAIVIFSLCSYLGYLYYEISLHEARLKQLNQEMKIYSTSYRKTQNIESLLERINDKDSLKQALNAGYLAPLSALNTLIQFKTNLIWFDQIEFNGLDGSFTVNGGATNYKALAAFIGELEQDKDAFRELKPEQATVHDNSAGREYVQFKISGILVKRGEQSAQSH